MTTTEPTIPTEDTVRPRVHAMWAAVAGNWAEYADAGEERVAAVTERMLSLADPRPGQRVLELACGAGGLGMAAADRVGAAGEVELSDVAAEMVAVAAARVAARGLTNVRTATLDLEEIDRPDGSSDVVLCREGLMFAFDPARAVAEIHRVLRPGGRVAVSVWGPKAENPWLGLVFDAVGTVLDRPVPPPGIPGPMSLGDADGLASLLAGAGFDAVAVERVAVPLRTPSFEAWWRRTSALAGPLAMILAGLDEDTVGTITDRLRDSAQPYFTATGGELPGAVLVASGRRV